MTHIKRCLLFLFITCSSLSAQTFETGLTIINDYNAWGWDSVYVLDNGLIKTTVIPVAGGRVLEYTLDDQASMFINPARLGFLIEDGDPYAYPGGGIGGYKVWPAPQADWQGSQWPPPPILAWGPYTHKVLLQSPDSLTLFLGSQQETSRAPGIRFERQYTFYKNSSRVKVDQIIINENTDMQTWGVWDITQSIVNHADESDYENFWVYFPKNPDSHYGDKGYSFRSYDNPADGWHSEVTPGIIGAYHQPADVKLFGDPHEGWICYVDEKDGYAFAKTFSIFPQAIYPDDQARVAVYFNGNPKYMEVEVMSPLVDLAANGGRYAFTINWWAAKINGPILQVNPVGAVARHAEKEDSLIKGTYGVFHTGTAQLVFLDKDGDTIKVGASYNVSPLQTFNLSDSTSIPQGTAKIELRVLNPDQQQIGVLDSMNLYIDGLMALKEKTLSGQFELQQNYPNPFNPHTNIRYTMQQSGTVKLSIYNVLGQQIRTLLNQTMPNGSHTSVWDGKNTQGNDMPSGIYFYVLQAGSYKEQKKMLLLR